MRAIFCLAILAVGCDDSSGPTVSIPMAVVLDRTGSVASPNWGDAVNQAITDANAGLKMAKSNLQFKALIADSTNTPTTAVMRATDLVQNQHAVAIIADTSQDDIALNLLAYDMDASNDLNVPIVCMACTSPAINNPNGATMDLQNALGWNFRTVMSQTLQSLVVMKIALAKGTNGDLDGNGQFKISIYATDEPFGRGFSAALSTAAMQLHSTPPPLVQTVFQPAKVDPNTYNWSADVDQLVSTYNVTTMTTDGVPDFVFDVTFPQYDAALIKTYVQGGQTIPMLHTHASRLTTVIRDAGPAINGQEGTSYVLLDNAASGDVFATETTRTTGIAPQFLDSNSYDAAMAIMLASLVATRGMPNPELVTGAQIKDALGKINNAGGTVVRTGPSEFANAVTLIANGTAINYEGASGPIDFDAQGNVIGRLTHWKAQDRAFVDMERYDCVASPDCPVMQ